MDSENIFNVSDVPSDNSMSSTAKAIANGDLENGTILSPFKRSNQIIMDEIDTSQDEFLDSSFNIDTSAMDTSNFVKSSAVPDNGCKPKKNNILSGFAPSQTSTQIEVSPNPVENNVILVQPSSSNEEISKKFLNNDMNIAIGLKNSNFKHGGIESVSKNRSRNLLIVKIKNTNLATVTSILAITKLGEYDVICRLPDNKSKSIGVIGPIGVDTPLYDLQREIISENQNVEKIERIFKGKDRTPTMSIKVFFNQSDLPTHLVVFYQRFRVSTFVGNPWQCYRCQGFGHNAAHCRYKPRCLICAGPHQLKDCDKKSAGSRVANIKCINCKGDHTANYGGCPFYKDAKQVEKIRVLNKVSYRDAVKLQKEERNNSTVPLQKRVSQQSANYNPSQNYSNHSETPVNQVKIHSTKKQSSISTQTVSFEDNNTQTEHSSLNSTAVNLEIIKGLAMVISDLFENKKPNEPVSKVDVIEVFNKTFKTNILISDLNKVHKPTCIPETQDSENDSETDWSLVISPKSRKRKNLLSPKEQKSSGFLTQLGASTRSANRFKKKK